MPGEAAKRTLRIITNHKSYIYIDREGRDQHTTTIAQLIRYVPRRWGRIKCGQKYKIICTVHSITEIDKLPHNLRIEQLIIELRYLSPLQSHLHQFTIHTDSEIYFESPTGSFGSINHQHLDIFFSIRYLHPIQKLQSQSQSQSQQP
jgi:hypothetical protein